MGSNYGCCNHKALGFPDDCQQSPRNKAKVGEFRREVSIAWSLLVVDFICCLTLIQQSFKLKINPLVCGGHTIGNKSFPYRQQYQFINIRGTMLKIQ